MASLVSVHNVIKRYVRGKQTIEVLHQLDLEVPAGQFLALMGPSGSGKTTLLNLIGGLDRPTAGEVIGLTDHAKHKPAEFSGGQQQRVAIARALISDPTLLVCDEPTGDLDRASASDILGLIQTLNRQQGKTIILVTHDQKAADYASRVLHVDKGQLVETEARTAA
jgi:ABC-type lipoprotein export system ATPase subunit